MKYIEKPIVEHSINCDGSINYACSNMVNPLVSIDMVKEHYDMQAKSLRTIINEIYQSISKINESIETFQSDVNRTRDAYILLQKTVNDQLNTMEHQIKNAQQQTVLQLSSFNGRMDHFESEIDTLRKLVESNKGNTDEFLNVIQSKMNKMNAQMTDILNEMDSIHGDITDAREASDKNSESITTIQDYIIPKIENAICTIDKSLNEKIDNETTRAIGEEKKISNELNNLAVTTSEKSKVLSGKISDEELRAKQQEIAIIDMIKSLRTESNTSLSETNKSIATLLSITEANKQNIENEKSRAINAEDGIRALIGSESARAQEVENSITIEQNKMAANISSIEKAISDEIINRKNDVEALCNDINDLSNSINDMIDSAGNALMEKVNELIEHEASDRKKSDNEIMVNIDNLTNKIESIDADSKTRDTEIGKRIDSVVDDIKTLESHIDDMESTNDDIMTNMSDIIKRISDVEDRVNLLQHRSDSFDDLIKDKINQASQTIITRIESLDNRLDREINNVRADFRRIDHRISVLEGVPDSDCNGCDDPIDNPFLNNDNPFL